MEAPRVGGCGVHTGGEDTGRRHQAGEQQSVGGVGVHLDLEGGVLLPAPHVDRVPEGSLGGVGHDRGHREVETGHRHGPVGRKRRVRRLSARLGRGKDVVTRDVAHPTRGQRRPRSPAHGGDREEGGRRGCWELGPAPLHRAPNLPRCGHREHRRCTGGRRLRMAARDQRRRGQRGRHRGGRAPRAFRRRGTARAAPFAATDHPQVPLGPLPRGLGPAALLLTEGSPTPLCPGTITWVDHARAFTSRQNTNGAPRSQSLWSPLVAHSATRETR